MRCYVMTSGGRGMTRLLTMKEAAKLAGISVSTLWRMRKETPLKTVRLVKREMVQEPIFLDWLANRTLDSTESK